MKRPNKRRTCRSCRRRFNLEGGDDLRGYGMLMSGTEYMYDVVEERPVSPPGWYCRRCVEAITDDEHYGHDGTYVYLRRMIPESR